MMPGRRDATGRRDPLKLGQVGPEDVVASLDALPIGTESREPEPSNRRLLLVEDDWHTHNALRKILGKLGWEVQSAMTVSAGLSLLEQNPDALILDIMLPDGDGLVVLEKARRLSLVIRVAVTTGVDDTEKLVAISNLQPDALLRKPLELNELLRVLETERPSS
jgi:CheY-like chemotaxis protein